MYWVGMPAHRVFLLALIAICGLAAAATSGASAAAEQRFVWQVVAVTDGDTLTIHLPGLPDALNPVAIRVKGIDTPESGGRAKCTAELRLAHLATRYTEYAVARGRRIEFAAPVWDKYSGRIDAEVWIDGRLLSRQLIEAGLARPYDGGKRRGWC